MISNNTSLVQVQLESDGPEVDYAKKIEVQSKKFIIGQNFFDFDPNE